MGRKEFQATSGRDCFEPAKAAQLIVAMMVGLVYPFGVASFQGYRYVVLAYSSKLWSGMSAFQVFHFIHNVLPLY